MPTTESPSPWSARVRLGFIEQTVYWRGWIGRGDLRQEFRISGAQAARDLGSYLKFNPGACEYNTSTKRYEATPAMGCKLRTPEVEDVFDVLPSALPVAYPAQVPRPPTPAVAREIVRAIANRLSLEVQYRSLHSGSDAWRQLSPVALAKADGRWHARAWDHAASAFKDFVLSRMVRTRNPQPTPGGIPPDSDWHTWVRVSIRPHRRLNEGQRRAVEHDYAMKGGQLVFAERKALLPYTLALYRLTPDHEGPSQLEAEVSNTTEPISGSLPTE